MVTTLDVIAPLFVPANRPERFEKAAASGADAVILDLEDAVPPQEKAAARAALRTGFTDRPVIVRINGAGTPWHAEDLAAALALPVAAIMLPKAEAGPGLEAVCAAAARAGRAVVALVETARGLADARRIAATEGVARLAFGSVDFSADLGCAHSRDALLAARSELVMASRLAGRLAPLDGVTTAVDDAALAADDARHARALGLGGKLCIHPRQIGPVMEGFRPDEAELAWARRVMATEGGAVALDGAMVDEPVRLRARAILAWAGKAAAGPA